MIAISSEFEKSIFDYDKTIDVLDVLPYNKNEIIIQPNELSYHRTINVKLSYLYDNFMYLYSRCSIPNYVIPTTFNGFIGVTGSKVGIYNDTTNSDDFSAANFKALDFAQNGVVYRNNNMFYLFVNCISAITVLRHDYDTAFCQVCPNIITLVDALSGELTFQKINSISILEDRYLCVSDEKLDVVFKYDLLSYFSNENIFKNTSSPFNNRLFLLDILGGQGSRYDSLRFEKPKKIPTYNNTILVEDFDNKIFKFYNSNFNFLFYETNISLYKSISSFNSLKLKDENEIYGIVDKGYYSFDLSLVDKKMTLNTFISLSSVLESDEKIIDMNFSKYEKDIVYILTNKSLIKKWDSRLTKSIGRKKAVDFGANSHFKWFMNISKTENSDFIYVYMYNSTARANQILIYTDELDLITILNDRDFKIYSKDEVLIKEREWNQSWIYEKSFKKLLHNIDFLKNNVCFTFVKDENSLGDIISIEKIYNTSVLELSAENFDTSCIVGINENFQSSVINRELLKIYELQENVLNAVLYSIVE
jgi:hypothetical protein